MAKRYYLGEGAVRALDKALPYIDQQMRTTKFGKRVGTPLFGGKAFLAKITSEGPNEEEDFTDARYWIREVIITNSDNDHTSELTFAYPEKPNNLDMEDWRQVTHWEVAINTSEIDSETHFLSTDDDVFVTVYIEADQNNLARYHFITENMPNPTNPEVMLPTPEGTEEENEGTWDRTNQAEGKDGVTKNEITRIVYNHSGDEILYGFYRTFTYDAFGRLVSWTGETRYIVDTPGICP